MVRPIFILLAGLGLGAAAPADKAPANQGYKVDLTIHEGDRLVGSPSLHVTRSEPAAMAVDMEGGYAVMLIAHPAGEGAAEIGMEISLRQGGKWVDAGKPRIRARLGETASMGYARPASGPGGPLKLSLVATATGPASGSRSGLASLD